MKKIFAVKRKVDKDGKISEEMSCYLSSKNASAKELLGYTRNHWQIESMHHILDVTFTNNRCYKKCHDEILAVFMGSIENVNILNNTFTMSNSTDPSTMSFTFGSNSSKKAKNIRFEENTVNVKTTMSLLHSRNADYLSIKNNNIKFEKVDVINGSTNTFIMYFPKDNEDNNSKNVTIENNNIELNNATSYDIRGILSSSAEKITFNNNKITSNSEINEAFTGEVKSMNNNNMIFNKYVRILLNKPKEFNKNSITFNSKFDTFAQYHIGNMNYDSNIKNNIIESNYDEISAGESSNLLMFNGGTLNNHIVTFEGNTINFEKANYKRNLIYILNLADATPQTIKIVNNKMDGYKYGWKNANQEMHNIILENN